MEKEWPVRRVYAFVQSATVHVVGLAIVAWSSPILPRSRALSNARRVAVAIVATPPPETMGPPGLQPLAPAPNDAMYSVTDTPTVMSISALTFNFRKIADHAKVLFPFVVPGLALEQFALTPRSGLVPILFVPSTSASGKESASTRNRPLALDAADRQALVDSAWSRRERWQAFQSIAAAADGHHPDDGDLPMVLQMFREQDGLQPYVESGVRDHGLWVSLGLAADHVEFIGFISSYASAHPSSKATTELLLLLDLVTQGSLEDLLTLLSVDVQVDLEATRRSNRTAYDFVVETLRYYKTQLAAKRLTSTDAIRAHYDAIRLAILDGVVRSTPNGYRAGDARFLMGDIYWRQGNVGGALEAWRGITRDESDTYVATYSELMSAIQGTGSTTPDATSINRALNHERSRWRSLSYDRLSRFGYRFDTF